MDELAGIAEAAPLAGPASREERPSDRQLLRGARKGSPEAVEALIERHWDRAHRIAYGILGDSHAAEDVAQEAMLSVVSNVGRVDPFRPFAPWLHAVVTNRALDWARARARRAELPIDQSAPNAGLGEPGRLSGAQSRSSEDEALLYEASSDPALESALGALSPEHRAVITLRFIADFGPKQIARTLGIPTGTVGSRLRRALDQLRAELEAGNE